MIFPAKFKKIDWPLVFGVFFLSFIGLLSLFADGFGGERFFEKQLIWLAFGIFLAFAASLIDYRVFKDYSAFVLLFYGLAILSLVLVLVFGEVTRGSRSWFVFVLPFLGKVSIQPVEFAKISLILILAKYFSMRHIEIYRLRHLLVSGFYVVVPFFLVLRQPDFGSALVLAAIWVLVILFSGVKIRHFLTLVLFGIFVSVLAWNFFLANYQKARIIGFVNPKLNVLGESYQSTQAKIAIGSGGFFGRGFKESSQSRLGFLPEASSDFIFASIAEKFGLFGAFAVLAAFIFVFWRILKIGLEAENNFAKLFVFGYAALIFTHFAVNVGMNLSLLPITGIGLPFVSYGGSGLLSLFFGLGILQSFRVNR